MARELNRELFAERGFGGGVDESASASPAAVRPEEVRALTLQVESISKRMKEFESRVETMHTKVEDLVTQNRQRFERVQAHFQRQTEMMQSAMGDIHNKIAQVVSRMNERKLNENMVKEMVDRHGSVVQTFETRLQQFQKVMSEQELQLMHAKSELKQALHELSKLKKF